jgi:hypothetical protein
LASDAQIPMQKQKKYKGQNNNNNKNMTPPKLNNSKEETLPRGKQVKSKTRLQSNKLYELSTHVKRT